MNLRSLLGSLSITSSGLAKYQGIANFLKWFNGYSPFPINVDFILTMRCNLNCPFCVCNQEGNTDIVANFRRPELSLEEWKHITSDIKRSFFFRPNLNLLGGEPSIYKGYLELAKYIKSQGFRCSYTTNGTFLARDAAEIVDTGVDVIAVSIDGGPQLHNQIRGAGVFARAAAGIRAINEEKEKRARNTPFIFLACTINDENYDNLTQLIETARDLEIKYVNFLHLQFPDVEMGNYHIDVNPLVQQVQAAKQLAKASGISVNFTPPLKNQDIATYYLKPSAQLGKGCVSPWLRMVIMPNGKVIPCGDYVVGDLKAEGETVKTVWNSAKFRAFRRNLAHKGLLPDCERCCRKQYY
jgi:Fe-coproporphyrin III synthase